MNDRPLRILQVSTADKRGGAEHAAWNLFQVYRARGPASWLAVGEKRGDDPDVLVIGTNIKRDLWSRFCRSLQVRPRRKVELQLGIEDFNFPATSGLLTLPPQRPDLIHCHNLHGDYFDLRILPWLSHEVPVILNLHDTWLLSGHCAYSLECDRWKTGCGQCPDLNIYPAIKRDATAYNWRRKRDIFARSRLYVATPSQWLMRQVEQSMLAPGVVEARVIPNAIELSVFHPADRQAVRAALKIPQEAKVLLFSATVLRRNRFKDYATLRSAVAQVAERMYSQPILFIALGENAPAEQIGQAEVRFVSYQTDSRAVARYCQAADIYIHAARAEVWGLTITEALACGTPVVATAVGGIPEQVKGLDVSDSGLRNCDFDRYGMDEATGILVPLGDARRMALGIERLLQDEPLRLRMGENAARDAVKRFGLQRQADDFLRWYQEILKCRVTPPSTRARHAISNSV